MPTIQFPRHNWDPVVITYGRVHVTGRYIVRPTRVEGTAGGPAVGVLGPNVYPIALYADAVGGADPVNNIVPQDMPIGFHRGHIMANVLGGVNSCYNLVPMPSTINNGAWSQMETALRQACHAARHLPQRIYFRADLGYADDLNAGDPTLPTAVRAWGYQLPTIAGGPGIVAARTAALTAAIAGGAPNRIHSINPPLSFAAPANQPFVFTRPQTAALTAVNAAYVLWGNQPTVGGGNTGGRAAGGRGDPPAGTAMGPYCVLDVVDDPVVGVPLIAALNAAFGAAVLPPNGLAYPVGGINKRNNTNANVIFRPEQKRLIRLWNWWTSAGRTTSDNAWFDQSRRLGLIEAEIDHIIPKTNASSSNYYWNAQVTSHDYNITKGAQSEAAMQQNWVNSGVRGPGGGVGRKRKQTDRFTPRKDFGRDG